MKIIAKNGCDFRPKDGEFNTTTLIELSVDPSLGRVPSNVIFLVDASSSMGGQKWKNVKTALEKMVEALQDDDRVGLVLFHTNAKEVFPLASLSKNRDAMKAAIKSLEEPQGVTNLEKGLRTALEVFGARSQEDKANRVNHVILLTDGFPTDDQGYRVEKTAPYEKIVKEFNNITLTGVGIGSADDYDSTFISRMSELGKGSYYHANDLTKFKEGIQAELSKLQSSVVGNLNLKFTGIKGKLMRLAKIAPEIVVYDPPGNVSNHTLSAGSMTKDLTAFLIQTNTHGDGVVGNDIQLFEVQAEYDGKLSESIKVMIKTTEQDSQLSQVDPEVLKGTQILQVHLNGEQIRLSLAAGDKAKATRLVQNTTQIASNLGQKKVTRALGQLAKDIDKGRSVSDNLATIQDESKKTRLLIR